MRPLRRIRRFAWILATFGAMCAGVGCSKDPDVKPPPKTAPETDITFAPLQSDTTTFRVHFYWNAYDNDGEVVRFRLAVDADTAAPIGQWQTTTAKDTILLFLVDPVKELKLHVFKIAAEDNEGNIDPTPASRAFSAKTVPPTSKIERGPGAFNPILGPNFTFEWSGIDPDGSETGTKVPVDSFQYLLLRIGGIADTDVPPNHDPLPIWQIERYVNLIRAATGDALPAGTIEERNRHDDWKWQGIRGLKHRFRNVSPGEYVFALRAVDIAGATEKDIAFVRNIRHFTVSSRNAGPTLIVRSSVLNRPLDPATGPEDYIRKQIQIFEGETISFAWSASAEAYGGEIIGYTYALDDTSSFPGLDPRLISATFTPAVLAPGSHFLYVRAVDDGGLVTNMVVPLLIVHPSFKDPGAPRQILYVDDATGPNGTMDRRIGSFPSDAEETDWWTLGTAGAGPLFSLGVPYTEWDTVIQSLGSVEGRKPPEPKDLASYTTVVWVTDSENGGSIQTGLYKTVAGGNYSELQGYLRAGGTLILTGWNLAQNTSNPANLTYRDNYPAGICSFADRSNEFNGTVFPRMFMGVDNSVPNVEGRRFLGAADFVRAIPNAYAVSLGFDTAVVDTGSLAAGAKWETNLFPAGNPDQTRSPGLGKVEGWIMARFFGCLNEALFGYEDRSRPIAQVLYTYHGVPKGVNMDLGPSPREGLAVGAFLQSHDLGTSGASGIYNPNGSIGRLAIFTFPFYFLKDDDAINIMVRSFQYVNVSPTLP